MFKRFLRDVVRLKERGVMVGRGRFELPTMRPRKVSACKADVLSRALLTGLNYRPIWRNRRVSLGRLRFRSRLPVLWFCQVSAVGLDLLSSTPGITVVVGFPFTASPESPCASEACSLVLAVNGRTSTAHSRPERGSLAHCQARILRWPTNQISSSTPLTWSESLPS